MPLRSYHRVAVACSLALLSLAPALAQTKGPGEVPDRAALIKGARAVMEAARYCAVITTDAAGRAQSRVVDAFAPGDDMVVWFATNPKSRKVAEIRRDPRVTLYYFDSRDPQLGYVTLLGHARLVDDPAEKQKRWKPEWKGLWPDRGASYLLVEVTPDRLEVLSPRQGIGNDPVTWAPRFVEFTRPAGRR